MAGIMSKGLGMQQPPGLRPDEVANTPWMNESNPIMDLLIRAFAKTDRLEQPKRKKPEEREDEESALIAEDYAKRTADVKGPVEAKFAREHAKKRKSLMRDIY